MTVQVAMEEKKDAKYSSSKQAPKLVSADDSFSLDEIIVSSSKQLMRMRT